MLRELDVASAIAIGMAPFPGHLCHECPKVKDDPLHICTAYGLVGMNFRHLMGQCPLMNRWAEWRTDAPKARVDKIRIGQQKSRR